MTVMPMGCIAKGESSNRTESISPNEETRPVNHSNVNGDLKDSFRLVVWAGTFGVTGIAILFVAISALVIGVCFVGTFVYSAFEAF
jgi:hypothetical protein